MRNKIVSLFSVFTILATLIALSPVKALAGSGALPIEVVYSSTNVNSSAYVELVHSTVKGIKAISVMNSGPQDVLIAVGAAGSEANQLYIPSTVSSLYPVVYPISLGYGSRLSVIAASGTNSTGQLDVNVIYN
jgi:hypothetical protein